MDYVEARDARQMSGLRLALTRGIPNPFGEAAKAIFHLKGLTFTPVAQYASKPNEDLLAWTGHRNAPTAIWNDEPARAGWLDILMLAERLAPDPPLLPSDRRDRAWAIGLANEINGEDGYGWNVRMLMFPAETAGSGDKKDDTWSALIQRQYGGSAAALDHAAGKATAVLRLLAETLHAQMARGSRYFVGDRLTAVDIYWAALSIGVKPLPDEMSATPGFLRKVWGRLGDRIGHEVDSILVEHRDYVWKTYLPPRLDF